MAAHRHVVRVTRSFTTPQVSAKLWYITTEPGYKLLAAGSAIRQRGPFLANATSFLLSRKKVHKAFSLLGSGVDAEVLCKGKEPTGSPNPLPPEPKPPPTPSPGVGEAGKWAPHAPRAPRRPRS